MVSPPTNDRIPAKSTGGEKSSPTFTAANADPQNSTSKTNAGTMKRRLPKIGTACFTSRMDREPELRRPCKGTT
jgi:hypothetical protein